MERKIKIPTEEEKRIEQLEQENATLHERVNMTEDALFALLMEGGM